MARIEVGIDGNCEGWVAIHLTHDEVEALRDGLEVISALAKSVGVIPEHHIQTVATVVSLGVKIPRFALEQLDKLYGRKGIILLLRERGLPLPLPPDSKMPSPPELPPSYWDMHHAESVSLWKNL